MIPLAGAHQSHLCIEIWFFFCGLCISKNQLVVAIGLLLENEPVGRVFVSILVYNISAPITLDEMKLSPAQWSLWIFNAKLFLRATQCVFDD